MNIAAINKKTGERINILKLKDPRRELEESDIRCPNCDGEMVVVAGLVRSHHFRHRVPCTTTYDYHPQSPEHFETKKKVAKYAPQWFETLRGIEPDFEVAIPEANRIADILFVYPSGWRIACEIQLSSTTIEALQKRTEDYLRAGIDTYWFIGKSALTETNREWFCKNYEFVLELEYEERTTETLLLNKEPL